jgi:hypothetical protein
MCTPVEFSVNFMVEFSGYSPRLRHPSLEKEGPMLEPPYNSQ